MRGTAFEMDHSSHQTEIVIRSRLQLGRLHQVKTQRPVCNTCKPRFFVLERAGLSIHKRKIISEVTLKPTRVARSLDKDAFVFAEFNSFLQNHH